MPYVNVQITKDGVTKAQKAKLVAEITRALVEILGKKPEHTHIVIDEIDTDNWGYAGMLTTEYRKRANTQTRARQSKRGAQHTTRSRATRRSVR